jgi:hypothetical protein
VVPWSAVYVVACDDGRGVLYQEDVPDDVSIVAAKPPSDRPPTGETEVVEEVFDVQGRAARRRDSTDRLLKAVPDDAVLDEPAAAPPRRRRPQLRLVK